MPPLPTPSKKYAREVTRKFDHPAISGCTTDSTVNKWFVVTSRALQMVNFFWNLVYYIKLSTFIGWHDTQALPRLCCDPEFSWTCQHKRDIYNAKSRVTSPLLPGLHAHQLQFVIVNVNNVFPKWPIELMIRFLPVVLFFNIRRYFTTKFNSSPIFWAHGVTRERKRPSHS